MRIKTHIFLIVCFAVIVRVLFISTQPDLFVYQDSYAYYQLGYEMIRQPSLQLFITPYRSPLYPLFLNGITASMGAFGIQLQSPRYYDIEPFIGFIQSLINVVGIVLYYVLLRKIFTQRYIPLLLSILLAVSVNGIVWERSIMTESLGIPFTILISYMALTALTHPSWRNMTLLTGLSVIGLLLRPALITIPITIFLGLAWYHHRARIRIRFFLGLGIFLLCIVGYVKSNEHYYGYSGLQTVGDINVFGRILQFRLPLAPARDVEPLYSLANIYLQTTKTPYSWAFINTYYFEAIGSIESIKKIQNFNRLILRRYPLEYLFYALADIPSSFIPRNPDWAFTHTGLTNTILLYLNRALLATQVVFLFSIPLIGFSFIRLLGKVPPREFSATLLGAIAYGQILITVLTGDGDDYLRFYSHITPLLSAFCLYWFVIAMKRTRA